MIRLHRLGGSEQQFDLNPDLVLTVESSPDTTITLTTGSKLVVTESPDSVTAAIREWRVGILERALKRTGGTSVQNAEARLRAVDNPAEHQENR